MAIPEWHEPLEIILKKLTEQTQALSWAHNSASTWCLTWDTRISLLSIVLGIFAGTGAVASDNLLPFQGNTTLVGITSLVVTTIQAINNKLAFAKRAEGHRMAALSYHQIFTKLNVQLNMPRHERQQAKELLDWITTETERLTEIEPQFPQQVKKLFEAKFHTLKDYTMPLTLNGLQNITIITEQSITPKTSFIKSDTIKIGIQV